jgi:hypothetical protein
MLHETLRARWWFMLLLPLTFASFTGCKGGASEAGSTTTSPLAEPSGLATPIGPLRFSDIVASPEVSFAVAFTADGLYFNTRERFVWRQGNGFIRWDIVPSRSGEPDTGLISIESETRPEGGYYAMGCLWHRQTSLGADGRPQARLSCSESGSVATGVLPLFEAMSSSFDEALPEETIAGREASCYSFDDPRMTGAVFCVDSTVGIPLLLSTVGLRDARNTQKMRAVSVSTAGQELGFPVQLGRDPVDGWWDFEGVVPMSSLQLPDFSQVEE